MSREPPAWALPGLKKPEKKSVFGLSPRGGGRRGPGARDADLAGVQSPSLPSPGTKPWTAKDEEESCVRELDLSAFHRQRLEAPSVGPGWERASLETPDPFLAKSPLPRRGQV